MGRKKKGFGRFRTVLEGFGFSSCAKEGKRKEGKDAKKKRPKTAKITQNGRSQPKPPKTTKIGQKAPKTAKVDQKPPKSIKNHNCSAGFAPRAQAPHCAPNQTPQLANPPPALRLIFDLCEAGQRQAVGQSFQAGRPRSLRLILDLSEAAVRLILDLCEAGPIYVRWASARLWAARAEAYPRYM